ncbi:hypothetical protein DSCOOX_39130 [Desulfosarcina ovata subsp. ovata]|uniref:VOC domain-containing protein n=1 Tax=Desulfosarcina ovata subsp. ovata TaxID=2752305 RepID=A0A5K8ADG3_9BACT|nr:hypothetical protein DSCOOX_39130 [Desulfosarcina ovata subsp. ovata]
MAPETGVAHVSPGTFVWHELLVRDAAQARAFYGALFGWRFRSHGRYDVVLLDGREIAGIAAVPTAKGSMAAARWVLSLAVADLARAMAHTRTHGGQVHEGPMKMGDRGNGALVRDLHDAQLVLLESVPNESVDTAMPLNGWLWDEQWSDDPHDSLDFYRGLAGFSDIEQRDGYWILKSYGMWRAGIREVFNKGLERRWVPVIRVADPTDTARQAETLGGRVLIGVGEAPETNHAALIAGVGALAGCANDGTGRVSGHVSYTYYHGFHDPHPCWGCGGDTVIVVPPADKPGKPKPPGIRPPKPPLPKPPGGIGRPRPRDGRRL